MVGTTILQCVCVGRGSHALLVRFVLRFFFFSSRRRHTRLVSDWSSDVCSSDLYPEPAYQVAKAIGERKDQLGILVCGTGIGMSIAANKYPGIRAAVAHDELTAQIGRASCRGRVENSGGAVAREEKKRKRLGSTT